MSAVQRCACSQSRWLGAIARGGDLPTGFGCARIEGRCGRHYSCRPSCGSKRRLDSHVVAAWITVQAACTRNRCPKRGVMGKWWLNPELKSLGASCSSSWVWLSTTCHARSDLSRDRARAPVRPVPSRYQGTQGQCQGESQAASKARKSPPFWLLPHCNLIFGPISHTLASLLSALPSVVSQ